MYSLNLQIQTSGPITLGANQIRSLLDRNVVVVTNNVLREAQRIVKEPIPDGDSGIRDSIQLERAKISTGQAKLETMHPLFRYVEERTRPHVIVPRNKKALAFSPRGSRRTVIVKRVVHPGTAGKHSFRRADNYVDKHFPAQIQLAVNAALAGRSVTFESGILGALQSVIG